MANIMRIQPDLAFIKELQSVGGESLKKCYQCATCSVVCPLSPVGSPFPRKEMIWAQWGLKDRLVNDIDIWLCHNCGQCSDLCPRGAKPGDLLAALRNMAYRNLAPLSFIGKWMSSAFYLPLLAALPVMIYLSIWIMRMGGLNIPEGEIVYGKLFPGDYTIDPIFMLLSGFVATMFFVGIRNQILSFKDQPRTFVVGYTPPSLLKAFIEVIRDEVVTHKKWKDCGDETPSDKQKFNGHFLLFYGFIALAIVTGTVATGHWGAYALEHFLGMDKENPLVHFLHLIGTTPMNLMSPVKLLANAGAAALLIGLTFLTTRRMNQDEEVATSSYYDWYLLGVIWTIALTGIGSEVLRLANIPNWAYPVYFVHIVAVFMLIAYLPWSKLGHLVYRTVALAYARHLGRLPVGK